MITELETLVEDWEKFNTEIHSNTFDLKNTYSFNQFFQSTKEWKEYKKNYCSNVNNRTPQNYEI